MKRILWTVVAVAVLPLTMMKDVVVDGSHITTRGEATKQRPDVGGHVAPTLLKSKTTAGVVGKLVIAATQTTSMTEEVSVVTSL